jgi:hypothetical protein
MKLYSTRIIGIIFIITGIGLAVFLTIDHFRKNTTHQSLISQRKTTVPELNIFYPFNNALFPPEIIAPEFIWNINHPHSSQYLIKINLLNENIYSAYVFENRWQPDSLLWEQIKKMAVSKVLLFSALSTIETDSTKIHLKDSVKFQFSTDPVGAPLFYRQLGLPFTYASHNLESIEWRIGDISNYKKPRTLLTGVNNCGNCHSFSNNGKYLGIDFNYLNDKGGYAISTIDKETKIDKDNFMSWNMYSDNTGKSSGFLSALSPDGRYVISTINDKPITNFRDHNFRFFPVEGVLAVYDRQSNEIWELHGANDPAFVQCNATWSPDGKTIIFAKAPALTKEEQNDHTLIKEYAEGLKDFKFDLWSMPFNNGKGGQAKPIKGAGNNKKSNYFPRVSPNGKWIVFTQSENFMLRQLDSKLIIVPFDGGEARELDCNLPEMNSWHSWSPNGKWIAFSTKYFSQATSIALSHINDEGFASPPVILQNFTDAKKAANLPEFVNIAYNDFGSITTPFLDNFSIEIINIETVNDGKYLGQALLSSHGLKPISAILETVVINGKIVEINQIETKGISKESLELINSIIKNQTIDMEALKATNNEETALVKAVENGLKKGL